jgi:hypothetical protein
MIKPARNTPKAPGNSQVTVLRVLVMNVRRHLS